MKKFVLAITLLVLLVVGALAALIIVDPVGVTNYLGLKPADQETARVEPPAEPATQEETKEVAAATTEETAPEETVEVEQERRPPRRPPTREELEKSQDEEDARVKITRKGRYVGPVEELPAGRAPRAEMYPLTIMRRSYPSPDNITVELAIANRSGGHWRNAYVALRSSESIPAQLFEIEDWGIDEVVGLDYTFPRAEVNDRIRQLRVVSVSGEQRESALADLLARSRQQYVEALTPEDDPIQQAAAGGSLRAPGLLGVLGAFQAPYTGVRVQVVEPRVVPKRPLRIEIPESYKLPDEMPISEPLPSLSNDAQSAVETANAFVKQGEKVEEDLQAFLNELEKAPFQEAIEGEAAPALDQLRESLAEFNRLGRDLSSKVRGSRDADVRKLNLMPLLTEYSRRVLNQLRHVEQVVRSVDPGFRIQQT